MSLTTLLYLIGVVESYAFISLGAIVALLIYMVIIAASNDMNGTNKLIPGKIRTPMLCIVALSVVLVFIPSSKTMYMMLASYSIGKVLDNPKVQQVEDKVFNIINDKLDEYTKEKSK